jgi:hypothetical protein
MIKFKKYFIIRIISTVLVVSLIITTNAYPDTLSGHLRKPLTFGNPKENYRYNCALIATKLHREIIDIRNKKEMPPEDIPELIEDKLKTLLAKETGIFYKLDEDGNIVLWHEMDPDGTAMKVYITGEFPRQFAPKDITLLSSKEVKKSDGISDKKPQDNKTKEIVKRFVLKPLKKGLVVYAGLLTISLVSVLLGIDFIYLLPLVVIIPFRKPIARFVAKNSIALKKVILTEWSDIRAVFKETMVPKESKKLTDSLRDTIREDIDKFFVEEPLSLVDKITHPLPIGTTDQSMAFPFAHTGNPLSGLAITEDKYIIHPEKFIGKRLYHFQNHTLWQVEGIQAQEGKNKFETQVLLKNVTDGTGLRVTFDSVVEPYVVLNESQSEFNSDTVDFDLELTKLATLREYYESQLPGRDSWQKDMAEAEWNTLQENLKNVNGRVERLQIAYLIHEHGESMDIRVLPSLEDFTERIISDRRYSPLSNMHHRPETDFEKDALDLIEILYKNRTLKAVPTDELEIISESIKIRLSQIKELSEKEELLLKRRLIKV